MNYFLLWKKIVIFLNPPTFFLRKPLQGDYLVISFSKSDSGKVYFISHDFSEKEGNRFLVANSITDFIESLFIKLEE